VLLVVWYLSGFDIYKIVPSGSSGGGVMKPFLFIQTKNSFAIVIWKWLRHHTDMNSDSEATDYLSVYSERNYRQYHLFPFTFYHLFNCIFITFVMQSYTLWCYSINHSALLQVIKNGTVAAPSWSFLCCQFQTVLVYVLCTSNYGGTVLVNKCSKFQMQYYA
jgi:hypothetical protein